VRSSMGSSASSGLKLTSCRSCSQARASGTSGSTRSTSMAGAVGWEVATAERSAAFEHRNVVSAHRLLLDQLIAGLLGECLEVAHRTCVGGDHPEHLPGGHVGQRFLGFQNGQRAVQATSIEFFVDLHGVSLIGVILSVAD